MFAVAKIRARLSVVLLAVAMLLPWHEALASCYNDGIGTYNFALPASITVGANAVIGSVIASAGPITPANAPGILCGFGNTTHGASAISGVQPVNSIFPIGSTGVGFRLVREGGATNYLGAYGCCQQPFTLARLDDRFTLELVKLGPVTNGGQIDQGTFARWMFEQGGVPTHFMNFSLTGAVNLVSPACRVNTDPISVTLPSISSTALSSVGANAGTTPFRISLNCSPGLKLKIKFDATTVTNPDPLPTVIRNTGSASGVGVQITDQSSVAVSFAPTAQPTAIPGVTPDGNLVLPYIARYYRTAALTTGTVTAQAKFTLTYE